jgi:hypothetical protein
LLKRFFPNRKSLRTTLGVHHPHEGRAVRELGAPDPVSM